MLECAVLQSTKTRQNGDMAEIDEPVHLSPYNPEWPVLFAA